MVLIVQRSIWILIIIISTVTAKTTRSFLYVDVGPLTLVLWMELSVESLWICMIQGSVFCVIVGIGL